MGRITCILAAAIPTDEDSNTSRNKHGMTNTIPWGPWRRRRSRVTSLVATVTVTVILMSASPADSFSSCAASSRVNTQASCIDDMASKAKRQRRYSASTRLYNSSPKDEFDNDGDDEEDLSKYDPEIAAQIRKARQLVRESKLKMEKERKAAELAATANGDTNGATADGSKEEVTSLPFFAAQGTSPEKIKSKTKGGVIADGEKMASLSKSESWEKRSLSQMFDKEKRIDFDGNLVENDDGSSIAKRDVAMAIFNLRKQLQNEDFKKVFNTRNPFIGEVE